MTVGSLFSGIGGIDLGLERAGFEIKWMVEINPFCQSILLQNFPMASVYPDVKKLNFSKVEKVDVLCGGFPCQPVSVASNAQNSRRGNKDERWLWPYYIEAIRSIRPKYALIENVVGLVKMGLEEVLSDLAGAGYNAIWFNLRASDLGAWHRRERIFIIAYPNSKRLEGAALQKLFKAQLSIRSTIFAKYKNGWWQNEPKMARVVYGIPYKLAAAQIQALGNAVIPQQAEYCGKVIKAMEAL